MIIKDTKPQVGIFEIVEDILLLETEDVQNIDQGGGMFDGLTPHLHSIDITNQVLNHPNISQETKAKFAKDRKEYTRYPRGRVDYDINRGTYSIMAAYRFFNDANIERITRAFHLPPYATGKIILESDDGHYGY